MRKKKSSSLTSSAGSEDLDSDLKIVAETSHSGKVVDSTGISSTVLGQRVNNVSHVLLDMSGQTTSTNTPTKSTKQDSEKKGIIQVTLGESMQGKSPTMTSFVEDFHAKRFRLRAKGKVSRTLVERFSSRYAELSKLKDLNCYSSKTLKDSLIMTEEELSRSSFNRWMNWGTGSNGRFLTANISESPRIGKECSLSDILEDRVDEKYFLSQKTVDRLMSYRDNIIQTLSLEEDQTDRAKEVSLLKVQSLHKKPQDSP
jgi:hypothetical protein